MRPLFISSILLIAFLQSMANELTPYVSSRQGVTLFTLAGNDSIATQKWLDADLDFILDHIDKPSGLNIFIMYGAYGVRTYWKRQPLPGIFISTSYDSLSNPDTLYSESSDLSWLNWGDLHQEYRPDVLMRPNTEYPGVNRIVAPYVNGKVGLRISYHDAWDTVNYYNHLLSIVDYAIHQGLGFCHRPGKAGR